MKYIDINKDLGVICFESDLGASVYKALHRAGIDTIRDLCAHTVSHCKLIHGLTSDRRIVEIAMELERYGLCLGMSEAALDEYDKARRSAEDIEEPQPTVSETDAKWEQRRYEIACQIFARSDIDYMNISCTDEYDKWAAEYAVHAADTLIAVLKGKAKSEMEKEDDNA